MAKAATSSNKVATPAASDNYGDFEWADDLPVTSRGGGGGAAASDTMKAIQSLPAPRTQDGKQQFARKWFELTDTVPANITDPKERDQKTKENLRKLTNKLSGITRRLTKRDASAQYTLRSVEQNGKPGVAVYRIEGKSNPVATPAPTPQSATEAPSA